MRRIDRVVGEVAKALEAHVSAGDTDCVAWLVSELANTHQKQWLLENESRASTTDDERRGQVKREIDKCNAIRVNSIQTLDSLIGRCDTTRQHIGESIPWPLTVGQLVDSLIISELKAEAGGLERPELTHVCSYLMRSLEFLLEGLAKGRVDVPPCSTIKMYDAD